MSPGFLISTGAHVGKEASGMACAAKMSIRKSVIGKTRLMLVITPFLLAGCVDTIFGCRDDLRTDVAISPDGKYKAVTRECGCASQTSNYVLTAVVAKDKPESCKALEENWVASVTASFEGRKEFGKVEAVWIDRDNLLVRFEHRQLYELHNYHRNEVGLYDVPGPNITVHSDL